MAKENINYVRTLEYEKRDVVNSHGINLGFMFHRGEMPDNDKVPTRLKIALAQVDHDGKFAPIKKSNYKDPGMTNIEQIVIPDNIECVRALGEFCIEAAEAAEAVIRKELEEVTARAKAAGISKKSKTEG